MNHKGVIKGFLFVLAVCGICSSTGFAQKKKSGGNSAYLFTYFTGNTGNEEAIRFAISKDGYTYTALNGNEPVITSAKISSTGGVRDPHILRGADGKTFYMVVTDMVSAKGWSSNRAMVLLKSTDLINWSSSVVNIQKRFANQENLLRVWAPQTIYDPQAGKYMIYWSMKHGDDPDKIYYAYANKDFTDLESEPKQLFFSPSNGACIDGDIIYHKGKYHLFFKTEGQGNGIKQAVSDRLTEGYVQQDKYLQQTTDAVEGAAVFKLNNSDDYILMYDVYMKGKYQFTKSSDLENFKVVDEAVSMDFHPRHGTVLPINEKELQRLLAKWYHPIQVLSTAKAEIIKTRNILVDTLKKTVFTFKNGANLKAIDPLFQQIPYVNIAPKAPYDFSKGSVKVTINITGQKPQIYTISASVNHNPVLNGYFADPEILYSNKTKNIIYTQQVMVISVGAAPVSRVFLLLI